MNCNKSDAMGTAIRLRKIREFTGLSQRGFAEKLDIHQTAISAIERGVRGVPPHLLRAIKNTFHVSIDYILTGEYGYTGADPLQNAPLSEPINKSIAGQGINILKTLLTQSEINSDTVGELEGELHYIQMIASGENDLKALEASIDIFRQRPRLKATLDHAKANAEQILNHVLAS